MGKKKQKQVVESSAETTTEVQTPVPEAQEAPTTVELKKPVKEMVWVKTKHGKTYRRASLVFNGVKAQYQLTQEQLEAVKADPWLVVVDGK